MINAKQEILKVVGIIIPEQTKTPLEASPHIKCATIEHDSGKHFYNVNLKVGWTDEEFKTFLDQMDFEYDNGYGTQELFGTIWLTDGTWLERAEYDGSEWWSHKSLPEIPEYLIKNGFSALNMAVNAIKFLFEKVWNLPRTVYNLLAGMFLIIVKKWFNMKTRM